MDRGCKVWTMVLALCAAAESSSCESLRDTFSRVAPAVVIVRVNERQLAPTRSDAGTKSYVRVANFGSGVLVARGNGVAVLTASHVVHTADAVLVEFADGQTSRARVVSSVPSADVALVELESKPQGIQPVVIGDSDAAGVGDEIFIVGAPHGLGHSLSVGHIGARRRSNRIAGTISAMELFQTDAAINPGNSGGPLFNLKGEVIGVVSHILTHSGGFEGTGFAVTSNQAKRLLLDRQGFWSGVDGYLLTGELAAALNVPQSAGLLVQHVAVRSAAEKLRLRPGRLEAEIGDQKLVIGGDIVLAVSGLEVRAEAERLQEIQERLLQLGPDDRLSLTVLRGGEVIELSARRGDL